jgi:threonyl-tRNA synthetase
MDDQLFKIRHSAAHVMAEAVLEKFPDARIAIGPPIEDGFYYDFDLPRTLTDDDLAEIEKRMRTIMSEEHSFEKRVVDRDEAETIFRDQPYKLELIGDLPADEEISLYSQHGFTDLCRGPHVDSTKELKPDAVKLLSVAGAYWRGKETNPMLQRIYGTAWNTSKELRTHLNDLKEREKRDHRKLGKELDLFSIHDESGPGLVFWHPMGGRIRQAIEDYWRLEHRQSGYEILFTPHIGRSWLWETSGHLDFYREGMYSPMEIDENDYYLKPMNCPFHIMIYNNSLRSYRELPLRWAELGTVYRYERSGVLHGMLRVRGFTQDDAHIICTPDQMESEIREVLRFSLAMLRTFGFSDIRAYLATKPEKSVGEPAAWDSAQESLKKAIVAEGLEHEMDEGGGAFYGPKIDLKITDALKREWQLSTIQFDFNLPERFDMTFVDSDGKEKRPFVVHRALLGSLERFFGILVEHYGGAFPVWLSPVQVMVIPVAEAFNEYAYAVKKRLFDSGIRVEIDAGDQRMNAKIRNAQKRKIPYMLVVGDREMSSETVSIRFRSGDQENDVSIDGCIDRITGIIDERNSSE